MTQEDIRNALSYFDTIGMRYSEKVLIMKYIIKEYLKGREIITRQFFEEFENYIKDLCECYTYESYLKEQWRKEKSKKCIKIDLPKGALVYRDMNTPEYLLPLVYRGDNVKNITIFELLSAKDIDRYEIFKWIFWKTWVERKSEPLEDTYYVISSFYIDKAQQYVPQFLERLMSEDKELFEKYYAEKEKKEAIDAKYYQMIYDQLSMEERDKVIGIWFEGDTRRLIKIID